MSKGIKDAAYVELLGAIIEVILQMTLYAGFPGVTNAFVAAKDLLSMKKPFPNNFINQSTLILE